MAQTQSQRSILKLLLLIAIIAGAFLLASWLGLFQYTDVHTLAATVRRVRTVPFAAPLFVLAYTVAATFGLPGSALTLTGGAIFGFVDGTLLSWVGATLGASGAYTLARVLGKDAVYRLLGSRAAVLDRLATEHGFWTVLRLRLIPIVPFNALNFACGFAGVDPKAYVAATAIGDLPVTAAYTYFADALLSGATGARSHALVHISIAGSGLVLLSFVPIVLKRWQNERPVR